MESYCVDCLDLRFLYPHELLAPVVCHISVNSRILCAPFSLVDSLSSRVTGPCGRPWLVVLVESDTDTTMCTFLPPEHIKPVVCRDLLNYMVAKRV